MTQVVIDVGSLFDDIEKTFNEIDYEPIMIATLELLAEGEQQQFDAGISSTGASWSPDAPATMKKKRQGIPLFETGALENSLVEVGAEHNVHETSHRGLLFGTDLPYSLFNQEGTGRIPARPHVGMTEKLLDAVCEEIADFAIKSLKE